MATIQLNDLDKAGYANATTGWSVEEYGNDLIVTVDKTRSRVIYEGETEDEVTIRIRSKQVENV